jgi:hypothetical protein
VRPADLGFVAKRSPLRLGGGVLGSVHS